MKFWLTFPKIYERWSTCLAHFWKKWMHPTKAKPCYPFSWLPSKHAYLSIRIDEQVKSALIMWLPWRHCCVFPERGASTNEWDRVNCCVDFRVIQFCTSHSWLLLGVVKNDFMCSCLCAASHSVLSSLAFSFLYSFDTTWANPRPGRPSRYILLHFLSNDGRGGLFVCVFLLSSVLLNRNVIPRPSRPSSFVAMSELEVTVIMDRAQKIFRAGDRLWGKVLVIVRRQTNIRGKFWSERSWKKGKILVS